MLNVCYLLILDACCNRQNSIFSEKLYFQSRCTTANLSKFGESIIHLAIRSQTVEIRPGVRLVMFQGGFGKNRVKNDV